ncbi:transcription termination factor Rho [Nocardioides bizhenqiangii]|uniref:Transcription termination factor Rho n=1 Tax=Nocardioides bizhenqiangii TaxID=3095076 RepID=A0ABZ0ZX28_9ACTN|nr:transcription termination factor Rho [Nocardioides sp. HM61]WQQ28797.1 transcription termination factor Rho [Nocardioides sp. HM61]
MLLADLKAMAGGMGIAGAGSMKKADLVSAIKAAQAKPKSQDAPADDRAKGDGQPKAETKAKDDDKPKADDKQKDQGRRKDQGQQKGQGQQGQRDQGQKDQAQKDQGQKDQGQKDQGQKDQGQKDQGQKDQGQKDQGQKDQDGQAGEDGEGGSRRNRRRRGRDRNRTTTTGGRNEPDTTILEDDVLVPAAGILDVLDNYAFVRTSGYLPGPDDVYLSLSMVRKYGLRRGDAIVGQVRQPREGERREKFNPMVRIDNVNGVDPEQARHRVDFAKLTPLYPSERLRLETEPSNMIGRVIDIASPIGKGQRGLIVSPAKAGKTMIMQSIANSITTNNPECHLMVVLVDERPEEVTDFERSVKGEVISSTFDRPAGDHTTVAELAIERAKRLVELGHDVVVLLDGITRLGRAYNLAAPASGRILSGGVDSAALYPPKKFFGAARNIENGGSLTILATALIDSGSKMDEVIFEEFKGTGNMEIRLRRDFADKRLFPAIDVIQSGTRREELLMSKEEMAIVWKLRRVLSALDGQQALEVLLEKLRKSTTNIDFLMQVQKTTPAPGQGDE